MTEEAKHEFKVGDEVTWTHTTSSGSSFNFAERRGKIIRIGKAAAEVKMRNGKTTVKNLSRLTPAGQKNEITRMMENLAGEKT